MMEERLRVFSKGPVFTNPFSSDVLSDLLRGFVFRTGSAQQIQMLNREFDGIGTLNFEKMGADCCFCAR